MPRANASHLLVSTTPNDQKWRAPDGDLSPPQWTAARKIINIPVCKMKLDYADGTHLNTLALGQTDPRLFSPDHEHVALSRGKGIVDGILDVHNVEASVMTLAMSDDTNTTHVSSTGGHSNDTSIEADEVGDFAGSEINLHSVIDLDRRIRITNPTAAQQAPSVFIQILRGDQPKLGPTTEGCSRTHVRASCVTKNGIPPLPSCTLLTLPSLYSASSVVIRWTVKRPFVS